MRYEVEKQAGILKPSALFWSHMIILVSEQYGTVTWHSTESTLSTHKVGRER